MRAIKDIEEIYTSRIINETVKVGDAKEALGDSPLATKKQKNTGPEAAEGVDELLKPEDSGEDNEYYLNKISQRLEPDNKKTKEKSEKIVKDSINICTMKDEKNIFDKLYSVIMEDEHIDGDANLEAEPGLDDELDLDDSEGDDEVTVSLPREVAEGLLNTLKDVLNDDGEDIEDFDDDGDLGSEMDDELTFQESPHVGTVKTHSEPKAGPDGEKLAGNKGHWKVPGKLASTESGSADEGDVKTHSEPKAGPDGEKLAGNKGHWKVKNPKSKHIGD